jgi:hypothetical protein
MLLLLIPQGLGGGGPDSQPPAPATPGNVLDAAVSLGDVLYRLGFQSVADMGAEPWVSVDELYQHADEAIKKIAYRSGVFLTLDQSVSVVAGTGVYELPATHVYTLAAALVYETGAPVPLRMTPVRDLWALDGTWPTTAGVPTRCSMDAGSVGTITVYPIAVDDAEMQQVCEEYPADVMAGATTVALPTVLQDYLSYAMLAGARGKESEAAMPEMAAHYRERMELYEQVIEHLWGAAQ